MDEREQDIAGGPSPTAPVADAAARAPAWLRTATALAMIVVSAEVFFAVPALAWSLLKGESEIPTKIGALGAACVLAGVFLLRRRVLALLGDAAARAASVPSRRWFLLMLVVGLGLRMAWIVIFPAHATSDGATYLSLSHKLLAGEDYESGQTRAFWPPGYPFFMMPWLTVLSDRWAAAVSNLFLFAGALASVTALARRTAGEGAARLAGALLAIWPNLVMQAGVPSKEGVLVLLLPLALWLFAAPGWRTAALAGLALGCATLVQPSVQLFVSVLLVLEVARRATVRDAAVRLALVVLAMAVVVAPWTIRNHRVLGEFVAVSTNAGGTFYNSNNPLASGHYEGHGERNLEVFDEVTRKRKGMEWGKEWIAAHPAEFARLALKKQVFFLGDDAVGAYDTLKRGLDRGGGLYVMLKAGSNATWLLLWAVILAAILQAPARAFAPPLAVAAAFGLLYFYAIHSVFEGAGKYHVPALGLLHALAASLVVRARDQGTP